MDQLEPSMDSSAVAALARRVAGHLPTDTPISEGVSPRDAYVTITRLLRMGFTISPPDGGPAQTGNTPRNPDEAFGASG